VSGLQISLIVAFVVPALALVLWPLLRGTGAESATAPEGPRDDRRLELEEEKVALYRALRELEFDHRTAKITDEDYRREIGPLRQQAAAALRALDAGPQD
jgi:hypothetical protein